MNAATEAVTQALSDWDGNAGIEPPRAAIRDLYGDHAAFVLKRLRGALRESPVEVAEALGLEQVGSFWKRGIAWSFTAAHNPPRRPDPDDRPVFAVLPVEENEDG